MACKTKEYEVSLQKDFTPQYVLQEKKKRKEKTPPNMSFSLAKAVVDALCLLHSTEKLFVQIITS